MTIIDNKNLWDQVADGLGISADEIKVYIAALKLGSRPASKIADETKLKRGHTYNLLEVLKGKALIHEFLKNNVRQFTASAPETILKLLEDKESELSKQKQKASILVKQLEEIEQKRPSKPKIRFFTGEEGIKAIYEDTLKVSNSIIYGIADFESVFPKRKSQPLHQWMWDYSSRRAKKNIWYYGIVNKSPLSDQAFRKRKSQKRKMKMIQSSDLLVEITIYQSKIAITSTAEELVGVIIENDWIAKSLKGFHEAIWKLLPDYKAGTRAS